MLIGGDDINTFGTCFSTFVLFALTGGNLTDQRNSNFIDVVASSPSFSGPVTIAPWRACLTPLQHASVTSHLARGLPLTYSDMAMDAIKFLCVEIQARNILKRNYFSF